MEASSSRWGMKRSFALKPTGSMATVASTARMTAVVPQPMEGYREGTATATRIPPRYTKKAFRENILLRSKVFSVMAVMMAFMGTSHMV